MQYMREKLQEEDNRTKNLWNKSLLFATGLPSLIVFIVWFVYAMVNKEYFSWDLGILIIIFVIFDALFLMVYYAIKNKN